MTTPLIMLLLMVGPYGAARLISGEQAARTAAAAGLALLFTFTASGHFLQTELMSRMLPGWMPARTTLVYVTGILELGVAAGFLFRRTRLAAAYAALVMLVAFFPANVYAAMERLPFGGHAWGPSYLGIRAPLQLAIVAWIYWFVIKPSRLERASAFVPAS